MPRGLVDKSVGCLVMNLSETLRQLINEHGGKAVKEEVMLLVPAKKGRPSIKDDDRLVLIRAAQFIGDQSCQSVTAALKRACKELDREWQVRIENGEKQSPDANRLLKRIRDWTPDPLNDEHTYFDAMIVLSEEVNLAARTNAVEQAIGEEN
jgi:hypothetical protein